MSTTADSIGLMDLPARPSASRRSARLIQLVPPAATADEGEVLRWALSVTEAANRRVAQLEARLAYLESLTTTDELTAVANRRGFLTEFGRAIASARRGGQQGVVIICDLDGFKAINDRLGHAAGNEVLRQVATALSTRVRRSDLVARLGGDEFALLLIGANAASARRKCEALGRAITAIPSPVPGHSIHLEASFGVAAFDGSEDEETLLHRADMAMYEEKRRRAGVGQVAEAG